MLLKLVLVPYRMCDCECRACPIRRPLWAGECH